MVHGPDRLQPPCSQQFGGNRSELTVTVCPDRISVDNAEHGFDSSTGSAIDYTEILKELALRPGCIGSRWSQKSANTS